MVGGWVRFVDIAQHSIAKFVYLRCQVEVRLHAWVCFATRVVSLLNSLACQCQAGREGRQGFVIVLRTTSSCRAPGSY
eukprot:15447930-Alexandrium_andersonii.AAC.2